MPRSSRSSNVRKLCGCTKWKECAHPWYIDHQAANRRYRVNLNKMLERDQAIARERMEFDEAKREARRAIVAWEEGRDPKALQPEDRPTLTRLLDEYRKRPAAGKQEEGQAKPIVRIVVQGRAFGEWRADEITREALEAFRRQRPTVAANRDLALLRAMFNWAVLGGILTATPFKVGTVSAVKLAREESRTRRLQTGELEKLLAACEAGLDLRGRKWDGNTHLRDLIVAALETGCRLGELLSLQWSQVRGELFLPAGKTKARKPRRVPVSPRLRAVLDGRRCDPAGDDMPADAYVFGDEVGGRRLSVKTAWNAACERAKIADLHFHDLRREAASRWMDAGVGLASIQRLLGHHNISQTSTYLAASGGGEDEAMRAFWIKTGQLTQIDANSGTDGDEQTRTDNDANNKAQQNTDGNEAATVH